MWKVNILSNGQLDANSLFAKTLDSSNVFGNSKMVTGIKKTLDNNGDDMHIVLFADKELYYMKPTFSGSTG